MGGDGNDTIHDGYGLTPPVDFDLIHGGNGDDNLILGVSAGDRDRVFGDAGHDQFVFRLDEAQPHGTGQDVVMDFAPGEDKLAFQVEETGSGQHPGTFAMFHSNHNGVLDNGDAHVSVRPITIDGSRPMTPRRRRAGPPRWRRHPASAPGSRRHPAKPPADLVPRRRGRGESVPIH
jgi:hypothetical protein